MSSQMTSVNEGAKRSKQRKGISPTIFFVSIAAMLAVGFAVGVYRVQIFASVASVFHLPASAKVLDTELLQQAYRQLDANFDGKLDEQALINGATKGMVEAAGDKYTAFFDTEEASKFNNDLEGSIGGGVGAQVGTRDEVVTLVKIIPSTPAEREGLKAGDKVRAINGESTKGMTTEQAVERIRGEVGTTVKLAIERDGQQLEVSVTRAEITAPSVSSEVKDGIGIMTISRFDQSTGDQASAAARSFKEANIKGVILDLRGNPGGYLTASRTVASIWLDQKVIVTEKTDGRVVEELRAGKSPILAGVPTVVLVDGNSASASEIVAGALKDHKAATLVGETTYGKGTVQRLITLSDGSMLKVTVARWFTPNGVNLSEGGIKPDKEVKLSTEDIQKGNDGQMTAAKELLAR